MATVTMKAPAPGGLSNKARELMEGINAEAGKHTDPAVRRQVASGQPPAELAVLVQKIRDRPSTVTDDDVDALRAHYTEDDLFELMVAAALGAAEYRLKAALAGLGDVCE